MQSFWGYIQKELHSQFMLSIAQKDTTLNKHTKHSNTNCQLIHSTIQPFTMKNTLRSLKYSTVIIFLLSFTIHFSYIVYFILNPEFPDVRVYNSDLEDIELPISFQFCAHRKDTERNFQKMGYRDLNTFYIGRSLYNHSLYGWLGHKKEGGTFESVQGMLQNI